MICMYTVSSLLLSTASLAASKTHKGKGEGGKSAKKAARATHVILL